MVNQDIIKKLDTADVYSSIKYLPDQIEQVIDDLKKISYPDKYYKADLIAISGMGGSIYNYYIINSLFSGELNIPITAINGYQTPAYLSQKTLFIGSSYSGTTEETVATTKSAIKNKFMTTAITAGGKLADLMKENNLPHYQFKPNFNPCGQPRVGVGYMIFGTILLLNKLNYLKFNQEKLKTALLNLKNNDDLIQNTADKLKNKLKNVFIILIGSEHLSGAVHAGRNQINETAKAFAQYHLIPELNHHLMEGLTYPKNNKLLFVFYNSSFYYERNIKRFAVTKKVLQKQDVPYIDISFKTADKLEEFLFYLQFNSYLSFFLGIDYGVNPCQVQWVDYFKKELGK